MCQAWTHVQAGTVHSLEKFGSLIDTIQRSSSRPRALYAQPGPLVSIEITVCASVEITTLSRSDKSVEIR